MLRELGVELREVAERVGPAVVGLGRGWHPGSGVVVGEGRVLTNAHNLRGEEVTVTFGDGRRVPGTVLGADEGLDVAVLETDTESLSPIEWAPSESEPKAGDAVVALANPGGRGLRATLGFVSATDRGFRGPGGRRIRGCLEHSAPLPRGSSGGPLVDPEGRLLGLNAVRLGGGFIVAVAADERLQRAVEALSRGESTAPVRLGVAVAPPHVARRLRRAVGLPEAEGVLVRAVEEGGAADRAGVRQGDLITAGAKRPIDAVDALHQTLDSLRPGDSLSLEVLRGTEKLELTVAFDQGLAEGAKR
jgi:serine protease Do